MTPEDIAVVRLADAVATNYGREVRSVTRIARGMGTTNWRVHTSAADYFLKQYPPDADIAGETAALRLCQEARAAGVPAPRVIPSVTGELLGLQGELAFALFEYFPDVTSGVALSCSEMAQAGHTLARLHAFLRSRPGSSADTATEWLALGPSGASGRRSSAMSRSIESREERDEFDRRTLSLLHRRLELLPRAAVLLASLPALARQVVHGDYNVQNILFRKGELVAVVDFRPPSCSCPPSRSAVPALAPETVTADPGWRDKALAFVEAYCRASPGIARSDIQFASHVWAVQLIRSEYGVRQHYRGPVRTADRSRPVLVPAQRGCRRDPRQPRRTVRRLRLRREGEKHLMTRLRRMTGTAYMPGQIARSATRSGARTRPRTVRGPIGSPERDPGAGSAR